MITYATFQTKKFISIAIIVIAAFLAVGCFFALKAKSANPLQPYQNKVNFNLYYPKDTTLKANSINISDKVLFYTVIKEGQEIAISEQANINSSNDIKIDGFNSISTPSGLMLIGVNNNRPLAVIRASTTLINLSGNNGLDTKTLEDVGQNLEQVK